MLNSAPSQFLATIAVAAVTVASPAIAQQDDPDNAATWYQQAMEQMASLSPETLNLVTAYDFSQAPTPQLREAIAQAMPVLELFDQGTRRQVADFGLDYSQGLELTLPHLSKLRQIARAANTAAMLHLHDGDPAGAAALMGPMYRASAHFGHDETLISTLVGQAVFALSDKAVQHAVDRAQFTNSEAATLLRDVEAMATAADPFNMIGAMEREGDMITGWLSTMRDDPEERRRVTDLIGEDGNNDWLEEVIAMPADEFDQAVTQLAHVMDRAVDILAIADPERDKAEMAILEAEIEAGEHGPLMELAPAMGKLLERKLHVEEMLAQRVESLRTLASGEVDPIDLANAAVWYLRAFEKIEAQEPPDLQLLRNFKAGADREPAEISDELNARLGQWREIIDLLREASAIPRCDFSIVTTHFTALAPAYAGSMRDALRLIHADAMRSLDQGETSASAERLAVGYRMIAHFSSDPYLVCSMLSHRAFLDLHEHLRPLLEAGLTDDSVEKLLDALAQLTWSDPLGYIAAQQAALDNLRRAAAQYDRRAVLAEHEWLADAPDLIHAFATVDRLVPRRTNVQVIDQADDNELLYYAAVMRYFYQPHLEGPDESTIEAAAEEERAAWAVLDDVFNLDELMATWREAPQTFGERWRMHRSGALHDLRVRNIIAFPEARQRARTDLHATDRLLVKSLNDAVNP